MPSSCRENHRDARIYFTFPHTVYNFQDVLPVVKQHKEGHKVQQKYEVSRTVLENKELLVMIDVNELVDINGGSLYVFGIPVSE